jgi:hypothetical protein
MPFKSAVVRKIMDLMRPGGEAMWWWKSGALRDA